MLSAELLPPAPLIGTFKYLGKIAGSCDYMSEFREVILHTFPLLD